METDLPVPNGRVNSHSSRMAMSTSTREGETNFPWQDQLLVYSTRAVALLMQDLGPGFLMPN